MELWGTRRHQGMAWGAWGRQAARGAYYPHSQSHPSFQLCCCGMHKKNGPICQPLGCLPDGQTMTLPVVRAWVWEGSPEQLSLEPRQQGEEEIPGFSWRKMTHGVSQAG